MTHTIQSQRFGVEVEVAGLTREEAAEVVRKALDLPANSVSATAVRENDGRVWKVVSDGSIARVNDKSGAEVVSPILTYADLDNVRNVVRALKEAGGKADKSCAIHIHVDAAPHNAASLGRLAKLVWKHEDLIMDALGTLPYRRARYCKPMEKAFVDRLVRRAPRDLDDLNELWYGRLTPNPTHYDQTRYHGLNLHSVWNHKTVEFRYFNASLNAGKIVGYIQFCLALSAKALNAKGASHERKARIPGGDKFDFRVFLLGLGMIGDEYKTARYYLLARLSGNASWRRYEGRRNDSQNV